MAEMSRGGPWLPGRGGGPCGERFWEPWRVLEPSRGWSRVFSPVPAGEEAGWADSKGGLRAYLALPCALPQPCCFVPRSQDTHLRSQSCGLALRSLPPPTPLPQARAPVLPSLTHSLCRASWIEVRPSWAQRPLTRLHPLWAPVFSFVWEALAWKLPRALLWSAAPLPHLIAVRPWASGSSSLCLAALAVRRGDKRTPLRRVQQ